MRGVTKFEGSPGQYWRGLRLSGGCSILKLLRFLRKSSLRNPLMYAVIETGGKQYRVAAGETIDVETIDGDVGAEIEFTRVLALVDGEEVKPGAGAVVKGTIAAHG